MQASILDGYASIDGEAWDTLVGSEGSPFLEHTFLLGLQDLGCAVPKTGWTARPVVVHDAEGRLVGGAPAWVKTHSMGEFVYDHGWADAAHRAGLDYYPKLVVGVPFTPVTGERLLVHPEADRDQVLSALLRGLEEAANDCFGLHVLFNTEDEALWLTERGAFPRLQYQFHWYNEGYDSFEGWLQRFPSKKRNKIRRERKDLRGVQVTALTSPTVERLDAMHGFYRNTCRQFGPWGRVYLSKELFRFLGEHWGDRLHLVLATQDDRIVAGAFNVTKGKRLYGRYWGADDHVPFLHFEVCYYQAVEECIRRGLDVFEPGHGGGHKYRRGFEPTVTWSSHWLADPRLHHALKEYTADEARHVLGQVDSLREQSPLRPLSQGE
ncbi:MAG: GNAT family N-acetyltransferase [Myxococcales bacterium]|nr:GNAT family N-acetyltransferase [Myxococcales bacterium]